MTTRRSRGEGGLHWDASRQRWIATATIGFDGRGKRVTRKASGTTKTAAKNKLREILRDHADGLTVNGGSDTVEDAVRDWLAYGLAGRAASTATNYSSIAEARIISVAGPRAAARPVRRGRRPVAPRPGQGGQHPYPAADALGP